MERWGLWLVVSALLAAAMSSVDSGVNSITAVVMSDFLSAGAAGRSQGVAAEKAEDDERRRFRQARLLAFAAASKADTTRPLNTGGKPVAMKSGKTLSAFSRSDRSAGSSCGCASK